jgi:hypothetical protein
MVLFGTRNNLARYEKIYILLFSARDGFIISY